MSSLITTVNDIQNNQNLHIVKFNFNDLVITMMSLELTKNIKINSKVKLLIKPTNISIAKQFDKNISIDNQLECKIISIENGELLSNIKVDIFDTTIESIITLESAQKLNLKIGDEVVILFNASDISILEILND